ncbi:hypothetical protein DY000_02056828 [Brassica cretica]|uniref:Phytocyanin domain-containing protein n=1 Tax=Brassica cretica TaxID=69181 RepID=A0ABQ7AB54_BRACR|nr:hypothetical protein DY000_02056828 [Brassica cretica]
MTTPVRFLHQHHLARSFLSETPTRPETQKDGPFMIVTSITSGVRRNSFNVGDSLIFEYANEINDVYEINGDLEFITCDPTSPVDVHKTGHDLVRLTEPGVHYFITSQSGYCEAGLKLRVMVGPKPKAVTYPNFPKKVVLSAMERLNNWLNTFKHQPHH